MLGHDWVALGLKPQSGGSWWCVNVSVLGRGLPYIRRGCMPGMWLLGIGCIYRSKWRGEVKWCSAESPTTHGIAYKFLMPWVRLQGNGASTTSPLPRIWQLHTPWPPPPPRTLWYIQYQKTVGLNHEGGILKGFFALTKKKSENIHVLTQYTHLLRLKWGPSACTVGDLACMHVTGKTRRP